MVGRPSTAAAELREPLVEYLNILHEAYLGQSSRVREATLPVTPSGKVNLSALAVAMKAHFPQLGKSVAVIRKGLYRAELLAEINLLAEQQGLLTAADRGCKRKPDFFPTTGCLRPSRGQRPFPANAAPNCRARFSLSVCR